MDPILYPSHRGPSKPVPKDDAPSLFDAVEANDTPAPAVMNLHTPTPRAPGSATSADAAHDLDTTGRHQTELRRVLLWFAAQSEPRTRHECADALYPYTGGIGPACGRIKDLIDYRCLEEVGRSGKRATLQITKLGRKKADALIAKPATPEAAA